MPIKILVIKLIMRTTNTEQLERLYFIINILVLLFSGGFTRNIFRLGEDRNSTSDFDRDNYSLHEKSLCDDDNFSKIRNGNILYHNSNRKTSHNFSETITIGFLGSYRQAQVMLGALPLAVAAVNEDKGKNNII